MGAEAIVGVAVAVTGIIVQTSRWDNTLNTKRDYCRSCNYVIFFISNRKLISVLFANSAFYFSVFSSKP